MRPIAAARVVVARRDRAARDAAVRVLVQQRLHVDRDFERAALAVGRGQAAGVQRWVRRHPHRATVLSAPILATATRAGRGLIVDGDHAERDVDALGVVVAGSLDRDGSRFGLEVACLRHRQRAPAVGDGAAVGGRRGRRRARRIVGRRCHRRAEREEHDERHQRKALQLPASTLRASPTSRTVAARTASVVSQISPKGMRTARRPASLTASTSKP